MKIIVAPDKFKGSLTSFEVCEAFVKGIKSVDEKMEVLPFPMADGGDGFAAVMRYYRQTATIACETVDPLGRSIRAYYEWDKHTRTAIIEMAVASGLSLLSDEERDPVHTSTYGTGLLIQHALQNGASSILLGLGGSATNDAGMGILSALGFRFFNEKGERLKASGGNLLAIHTISVPPDKAAVKFGIACDVRNVLYGPQGAAYVYAPQKGAREEQLGMLDEGLRNFARVIALETGVNVANIPGTGAAGGIAAGLLPYFDVSILQGIEMIIQASDISKHLPGAACLLTGEGKIDEQSGTGKVVGYLTQLAASFGIPTMALCGELQLNEAGIKALGLQKALAIREPGMSKEEAMKNAAALIFKKVPELLRQ